MKKTEWRSEKMTNLNRGMFQGHIIVLMTLARRLKIEKTREDLSNRSRILSGFSLVTLSGRKGSPEATVQL